MANIPTSSPAEPWAAVVAHYDEHGRVAEHLLRTVQALHAQGAQVCFVSTGLNDAGAALLAPYARVTRRENVGYDFWSYKVGVDMLQGLGDCQRLLLLNSSMVIHDPTRLLALTQAQAPQLDLLGLTLSHEGQPHLQSFWLAFNNAEILRSTAFTSWWTQLHPLSERDAVVAQQELGLSAHFARAGFRLGALHRPSRAQQLRAVARALDNGFLPLDPGAEGPVSIDPAWAEHLNPTMYAWDAVLAQLGVLKLELLRRNPHRINLLALKLRLQQDSALRELVLDACGCTSLDALGNC